MGVEGLKSAIIVYVATFHSSLSLSSKVSCSGDLRGYAINKFIITIIRATKKSATTVRNKICNNLDDKTAFTVPTVSRDFETLSLLPDYPLKSNFFPDQLNYDNVTYEFC